MAFRKDPNVFNFPGTTKQKETRTNLDIQYRPISLTVPDTMVNSALEGMINRVVSSNSKFVDNQFQAGNGHMSALIGTPPEPGIPVFWREIDFLPPAHIFMNENYQLFGNITSTNLRQGAIGDRYLIAAISVIAERPELVKRLFDVDQINKYGLYVVWINTNGFWEQIVLDDYLPCLENEFGVLEHAFSNTGRPEMWPMLLEKAYAKAYGSYARIDSGNPYNALRDLTGAPCLRFTEIDNATKSEVEVLWSHLNHALSQGFLAFANVPLVPGEDKHVSGGLTTGHTYPILAVGEFAYEKSGHRIREKLIKLKNPWNKVEWDGLWKAGSGRWALAKRNNLEEKINDGELWLNLDEFIYFFDSVGVSMVRERAFYNAIQIEPSTDIQVVRFRINFKGEYTFSVDQKDPKCYPAEDAGGRPIRHFFVRITIAKIFLDGNVVFKGHKTELGQNVFINNLFDEGEYIALIQPYFGSESPPTSYGFSCYGTDLVNMVPHTFDNVTLSRIEYLIWHNFAWMDQAQGEFQQLDNIDVAGSPYLRVYRIRNLTNQRQALLVGQTSPEGAFETITTSGDTLFIEPEGHGIIVEKKNPFAPLKGSLPVIKQIDDNSLRWKEPQQAVISAFQHLNTQLPVPSHKGPVSLKLLQRLGFKSDPNYSDNLNKGLPPAFGVPQFSGQNPFTSKGNGNLSDPIHQLLNRANTAGRQEDLAMFREAIDKAGHQPLSMFREAIDKAQPTPETQFLTAINKIPSQLEQQRRYAGKMMDLLPPPKSSLQMQPSPQLQRWQQPQQGNHPRNWS